VVDRRRAHPVQRRSVLDEADGWTATQALDLLAQGYSVARVVEVSGFDHRWVRFQAARMARADRADTGGAPVDDTAGGDGGIDGQAGGDR